VTGALPKVSRRGRNIKDRTVAVVFLFGSDRVQTRIVLS
jgi:hypothetical protein